MAGVRHFYGTWKPFNSKRHILYKIILGSKNLHFYNKYFHCKSRKMFNKKLPEIFDLRCGEHELKKFEFQALICIISHYLKKTFYRSMNFFYATLNTFYRNQNTFYNHLIKKVFPFLLWGFSLKAHPITISLH